MSEVSPMAELKRQFFKGLAELAEAGAEETAGVLDRLTSIDCSWRMSHPINELISTKAALERVWLPLKAALPDRRAHV